MGDDGTVRKFQKEMNAGLVSLLLLGLLDRERGPMYGYQISKRLEARSDRDLPMKLGTLYPVLRALEVNELVRSEVEASVSGPPRRWYSITDRGREALVEWREAWTSMRDLVDGVLARDGSPVASDDVAAVRYDTGEQEGLREAAGGDDHA